MIDTLRPLQHPSYKNAHSEEFLEIRSERFCDIPINVFVDDCEALSVARYLAKMKSAQVIIFLSCLTAFVNNVIVIIFNVIIRKKFVYSFIHQRNTY